MTWEETIKFIRTKPEYRELVEKAYFEEDLTLNVQRFQSDAEFKETLQYIKKFRPLAKSILDIGAGNGISSISFALEGYKVTAVEPDPSNTVGAGAIRILKESYGLHDLEVCQSFAENINFPDETFDVVYVRQAVHHANNLTKFLVEIGRVIKKNGLLLTIRDHAVFDEKDKAWFLENHPLHKFYGGENAYTPNEYKTAMTAAGFTILKELKFYDSVINYFPLTKDDLQQMRAKEILKQKIYLRSRIGLMAILPFIFSLYKRNKPVVFNEKDVPGRMYSYIAEKKS